MDKNLTRDEFEKLSKDEDYQVRRGVALNPNCPIDILERLSKDNDLIVRERVSQNPNCPQDGELL